VTKAARYPIVVLERWSIQRERSGSTSENGSRLKVHVYVRAAKPPAGRVVARAAHAGRYSRIAGKVSAREGHTIERFAVLTWA
jgi:hypothetical protein